MINTKTKYLGLDLKNPLIISACSLTRDPESAKKMESLGAAAITLPSLFEEEILYDQQYISTFIDAGEALSPEAFDYFPNFQSYKNLEGEEYLENVRKIKSNISIPVIASLNGIGTDQGWIKYAKMIQDAGADALELNIFYIPTDASLSALDVENKYIDVVKSIKKEISIPIAVKLNPFFSSLSNMAVKLDQAGANGLVLFNRFLEPDIDLNELKVDSKIEYSNPQEMRLPLHWSAILYGRTKSSIAAGRGVKTGEHMIKLIMAGADVVGIASTLYQHGIESISKILASANEWMIKNEYHSFDQMRGSMSFKNIPNPAVLERLNYMKTLKNFSNERF